MKNYDMFEVHPNMPRKVNWADITMRDGLQHEEDWMATEAKLSYLRELACAGVKRLEVTNLGPSWAMPQFKDAEEVLKGIRDNVTNRKLAKRSIKLEDVEWTAVTIRESAVERAIKYSKEGYGPDRILMMVSTDEQHHYQNSGGTTLPEYWKEAERCIKKCKDAKIKVCGTVSTIWGSPISGPTRLEDAVEFTKRWLSIGADDIEHADHDGSALPNNVYRYFSMMLDEIPNPELHIAHFHTTRGWGSANVLAALQAGIKNYEGCLGGIGGQPTDFFEGAPVPGTGNLYYEDPREVGLVSFEDMCNMMYSMGIDIGGIDVKQIVDLGKAMQKALKRRLRSGSVIHGMVLIEPNKKFEQPELYDKKKKLGEKPGQLIPDGWSEKAEVPKEKLVRE